MESPESTKPAPSSDATAASSPTVAQDSPFFAYVSNLSPIKTVNDGCAPSAFRDLNFPSPAPVFTSPHANPTRKRNLLKRCQYASPDSGNFSLKYSGSTKQISENKSLFGSNVSPSTVASVPRIMKDSECEFSTQLQSCSSPSGCVDEFLADPLEDSVDSCGPSNLCLNETVQLHQHSQDRYSTPDEVPKECAHSQNCCPSGHANEILSNQMDCAKATDSAHTISTCDLLEDAEIGKSVTKETISKLVTHNKNMKGGRDEARERLIEDSPGKNDNSVNAADEDCMNDNRSLNRSSEPLFRSANDLKKVDKHGEIIADLPGYQNSVGQYTNDEHYAVPMSREGGTLDRREEMVNCPPDHPHYVKHHSTENGKGVDLDYTPNMHTESLKIVPLDNNQHDISAASCNISSENVISNERGGFPSKLRSEGCQYQRAMRKRLEFDSGPPNLENLNSSDAESAKKMEDFQSTTLSGHALSRSSPHLNQTSQAHMDMAARSIRKNGSSVMSTAPRPSGIGLHLNSVVNVVALNIHINVQSEKDLEKDNLSASGETELRCSAFQRISDSKVCLASLTSTEDVSAKPGVDSYSLVAVSGKSDDDQQWNQEMAVPSSSSGLVSRLNTNPLKSTLQSKFLDQCIAPCNMKLPSAEDACESEELSEMSPRKKRKKASEDVGCKRCNCKKSKCLKLYCDCFAAGVYCADACACQECFNRPEYGDTVLETRQQIENRNPLAFAPKVVGRVAEVAKTSGEENKGIKPTSARHKRGCNCKRSQCLKKYCECFQAKVGCSFGCRCEGCKNSYGKKDAIEVVETEHIKVKDEKCKNSPFDYTDVVDIRTEKLNSDKHYRRLSPFTSLQEEDCNGGNVSKYQYAARRYISSPESSTAALFSHGKSQGSPTNSGDTNRVTKVRKGNSGQCPYRKELEVHDGDEIERSLPRWERLAERCNLRLLSSSSPSDPTEWKGCLRAPIFQGSGRPSVGSLRWHSSPITPMPPLGESRLSLESCSDSEPLNCHEDDTPDILKDACVPGKGLKSCSPNKKRVSPPHKHVHEIKTSSSSSMRSRKFILKSVPTFPSLTPYGNNITGHGT